MTRDEEGEMVERTSRRYAAGDVDFDVDVDEYADLARRMLLAEAPGDREVAVVGRPSFDADVAAWVSGDRVGCAWAPTNLYHADPPVEVRYAAVGRDELPGDAEGAAWTLAGVMEGDLADGGGIVMDGMPVELRARGERVWNDSWVKLVDDGVREDVACLLRGVARATGMPSAMAALGVARRYMPDRAMVVDVVERMGARVAVPSGPCRQYGGGPARVRDSAVAVGEGMVDDELDAIDLRAVRYAVVKGIDAWREAFVEAGAVIVGADERRTVAESGALPEGVRVVGSVTEVADEPVTVRKICRECGEAFDHFGVMGSATLVCPGCGYDYGMVEYERLAVEEVEADG